jgi:hypothetical protein
MLVELSEGRYLCSLNCLRDVTCARWAVSGTLLVLVELSQGRYLCSLKCLRDVTRDRWTVSGTLLATAGNVFGMNVLEGRMKLSLVRGPKADLQVLPVLKYHALKIRKHIWVPHILILGSFALRPLYRHWKASYALDSRMSGRRAGTTY